MFPDTFQNSFNERKCAGIMGDYANKCAMVCARVCCVVISLLSKVWRVEEHITSVFISCIRVNTVQQLISITDVKCIYKLESMCRLFSNS